MLVNKAKSNCISSVKRYKRYNEGTIEIHISVIMAFKKSWPAFENTDNSILKRANQNVAVRMIYR
jgi:flagellar assembly factor FliW